MSHDSDEFFMVVMQTSLGINTRDAILDEFVVVFVLVLYNSLVILATCHIPWLDATFQSAI